MATIVCPRCGAENSASAVHCTNCGMDLEPALVPPEPFEGEKQEATQQEQESSAEPEKAKFLHSVATMLRWIGRVWGLPLILLLPLVLFFWYLGSAGGAGPPGFVYLVGSAIVVGMIVAWWREGLGALISLAGLAGFYVALYAYERDSFRYWTGTFIPILPPIVCLLASSFLRKYILRRSGAA